MTNEEAGLRHKQGLFETEGVKHKRGFHETRSAPVLSKVAGRVIVLLPGPNLLQETEQNQVTSIYTESLIT